MNNEELNMALYEKMFADWENKETDYMDSIWQTVEERAKAEEQKHRKKEQQERSDSGRLEYLLKLHIDKHQKEGYNNAVIDNTVII